MKLTLVPDSNDPIIYIDDADLTTLEDSTVLNKNYKGTEGHEVQLDFANLPATDFDPNAQLQADQDKLAADQAKVDQDTAIEKAITPQSEPLSPS